MFLALIIQHAMLMDYTRIAISGLSVSTEIFRINS